MSFDLDNYPDQNSFDFPQNSSHRKAFVNHRVSQISQFSLLTYLTPPQDQYLIDIQVHSAYSRHFTEAMS